MDIKLISKPSASFYFVMKMFHAASRFRRGSAGLLASENNGKPNGLPREAPRRERSVVEMPGVEPGSNVYTEGQYDHDLLDSLIP